MSSLGGALAPMSAPLAVAAADHGPASRDARQPAAQVAVRTLRATVRQRVAGVRLALSMARQDVADKLIV